MTDFDIVFYHKGCYDGFTSAWVAHKHLPDARFIAIGYDDPFPIDMKEIEGLTVLFVDFCPDDDTLKVLVELTALCVIIDHHKTAMMRMLGDTLIFNIGDPISYNLALSVQPIAKVKMPVTAFDMEKSGARMTWEFFNPGQPVPALITYTMDYDLWQFRWPHSHAINAFIQSHEFEFATWDWLSMTLASDAGEELAAQAGAAVLRYEERYVRIVCAQAVLVTVDVPSLGPVVMMSVTCPILQSKIGNDLAKISPSGIGQIINRVSPNLSKVSLRSTRDVDLTPILTAFGGGGHAQAGGYRIESP